MSVGRGGTCIYALICEILIYVLPKAFLSYVIRMPTSVVCLNVRSRRESSASVTNVSASASVSDGHVSASASVSDKSASDTTLVKCS